MNTGWNPWHGCHKLSPGCLNCYVHRYDARSGRDTSIVTKNRGFSLPVDKKRDGTYKISPGERVYTCFSSDFFLPDADEWRREAWKIIASRPDLEFFIITKRIDRFTVSLPDDWGKGYDNVIIYVTCENQDRADYRLPIFLELPIKHKGIISEPMLEKIDMEKYLGGWIEEVSVGGESGPNARVCDYDWVLDVREQCVRRGVRFTFRQTGANFRREGRMYHIERRFQFSQARKAGIDYFPPGGSE